MANVNKEHFNNLFTEMINLMKRASEMKKLNGKEKKEFVINELKRIIPFDNVIEDMIIVLIDMLIQVENGELVINKRVINNTKKCCIF